MVDQHFMPEVVEHLLSGWDREPRRGAV